MARPTRVLILTHNYPRHRGDYAGIFLHLLARSLLEREMFPVVLAPHDSGIPEKERIDGVDIRRFRYEDREQDETFAYRGNMHRQALALPGGPLHMRRFLKRFEAAALKITLEEEIEVIAGHWIVPTGLVMRSLLPRTGLPMIISSHGTDLRLMKKFRCGAAPYLKPLFERISCWTVVSSFLKETARTLFPGASDKIEVLPLPHDATLFKPNPAIAKNDNLVVAVTRFTEQKRILHLIRAFARVRGQRPEARLSIYGSGELESEARSLVTQLNLIEAVDINPPVAQTALPEIYNRASVVVLNSFEEGFGLALSEAMLCGTAVIGTRSGGILDIIDHEETGLLVELDNESELADSIVRMLANRDLRIRIASAGRAAAERRFSTEASAGRYAELIRRAVNRE